MARRDVRYARKRDIGSGPVNISGTPADNQIAVWNSSTTVEGDPNLLWDGSQVTVTGDVEADEFIGTLRGPVAFKAQASETLALGDVVYISGVSGQTPTVAKADADNAAKMPAFGLVTAATSSGNPCTVITFGSFSNYDTQTPGWSLGDTLYVSTTPGALSNSPPTGEAALIQNIGKVQRVDNSAGRIKVGGAGRTNATPNLNTGKVFAGNASNQSVSTDAIYVDIANTRLGVNNTSPSTTLDVTGVTSTQSIVLSTGYTVAGLPAGVVGTIARVTDASTPSIGSTVVGGGSSFALVVYNGSNWTVMGV